MVEQEVPVTSKEVLDITLNAKCSGYDAEFVALATKLQVPLVTCDKKLAREFPKRVFELKDFLKRLS
ncbi:MAG TPA: type II toxin-antitoxin system VapC family toxin [Candidatus Ozemobacteraceae bacterium]|nr:type II toxin-antitoxin system VapC family toxin [Candidatus Ozemobacteraceae bacterium]